MIYWLRQIIAVILGVIWGVAPLKGFLGIAMWVLCAVFQNPTFFHLNITVWIKKNKKCSFHACLFSFCAINAGLLYLYFSSFQQIDEEEYGGTWELTKEGFMTSFALFLVSVQIYIK